MDGGHLHVVAGVERADEVIALKDEAEGFPPQQTSSSAEKAEMAEMARLSHYVSRSNLLIPIPDHP
jgi:hypothetical protein